MASSQFAGSSPTVSSKMAYEDWVPVYNSTFSSSSHIFARESKGVVSVWWPQVRWPLWWQLAAGAGRALCLVPSLATNLRLLRTRGERHASSSLGNLLKRCSPRIICGRVNHNRALLGTKPTLCGFKDRHQFPSNALVSSHLIKPRLG